jgi:hypothetical protein
MVSNKQLPAIDGIIQNKYQILKLLTEIMPVVNANGVALRPTFY